MDKNSTLYGAVRQTALAHPKKTALVYQKVKISYQRLLADIDSIAGWFLRKGVFEGDVVTLCMPNMPQAVVCFYALNKIGAIAHMVHPLAPEAQLQSYMRSVKSRMLVIPDTMIFNRESMVGHYDILVCSPAYYLGWIKDKIFSIKHNTTGIEDDSLRIYSYTHALQYNASAFMDHSNPNSTAVYLHSGGTGGTPKTICISSKAINALCSNGEEILGENPQGRYMLAVLPMFHGFGLSMGVHALLTMGGANTLMPRFNVDQVIKYIDSGKANYLIGVPTMYEALLAREDFSGKKLRNIRSAFIGGDFVSPRLINEFNERMEQAGSTARLYEGYGLTETVTVCSVNTASANKAGSVGKALSGVEIYAFDNDNNKLETGAVGELCVSGDQLMSGYLYDRINDGFFNCDGKKFVRTGDIGFVDEDGFVHFKSRIKRIAKVKGITVFPTEIENLCVRERSVVKECCIISTPDKNLGDALYLFVTLKEKLNDKERVDLKEDLADLIESRLSHYARPHKVFFLPKFPQTNVGKIDVNKLRDIYLK